MIVFIKSGDTLEPEIIITIFLPLALTLPLISAANPAAPPGSTIS